MRVFQKIMYGFRVFLFEIYVQRFKTNNMVTCIAYNLILLTENYDTKTNKHMYL